jgi:hypothetical protein
MEVDEQMRSHNRHILLFLDNAFSHDETGDTDNLKQFNTVSIRGFLDFFAKFSNRINLLDLGD